MIILKKTFCCQSQERENCGIQIPVVIFHEKRNVGNSRFAVYRVAFSSLEQAKSAIQHVLYFILDQKWANS